MSILDIPTQWTGATEPDDFSAAEIARLLGISVPAFRTRCYRGDGPPGRYLRNRRAFYPFAETVEWLFPIVTAPTILLDRVLAGCVEVDGCWVWTGSLSNAGYGHVPDPDQPTKMLRTHRVTYESFIADIPAGLDPDHLCRVRSCCNPWHIEPVSRAVNVQRGLSGGDAVRARLPKCACGREYDRFSKTAGGGLNRKCNHCRAVYATAYRQRQREGVSA